MGCYLLIFVANICFITVNALLIAVLVIFTMDTFMMVLMLDFVVCMMGMLIVIIVIVMMINVVVVMVFIVVVNLVFDVVVILVIKVMFNLRFNVMFVMNLASRMLFNVYIVLLNMQIGLERMTLQMFIRVSVLMLLMKCLFIMPLMMII